MNDGENDARRVPAAAAPSGRAIKGAASHKDTVVEEGTTLSGTMAATGRILVMGRLEGTVAGPAVEISRTGALVGRIKAGTLRSRGDLGGQLDADDIDLGGRILDQTLIRARELTVTLEDSDGDLVATQFGDCELQVGDEPDREKAIREASTSPRARLLDPRPR
jgi:cytoskeletal protein CcmA (bactofilin family)